MSEIILLDRCLLIFGNTTHISEFYKKMTKMSVSLSYSQTLRMFAVVENGLAPPTPDEISAIHRRNYQTADQMLADLSSKIGYNGDSQLIAVIRKTFIDILLQESKAEGMNLSRLTNMAVYLICWFRRYQSKLFGNRRLQIDENGNRGIRKARG